MATLSTDTGGKAFFDSNDFAPAFAKVQADTSAYYAIGFHSTNLARDGKYRKLTVKIDRPGIKLEYRPGYYAPADFKHSGKEDREQELEDQLASDLPATDMAVYMDALYFRLDDNRFYMPVSLVVPGSQIPFVKGGDKDKATLDIIGAVIDESQAPRRPRARHRQAQSRSVARRRGRRISSTPPASICRRANISSNLWCAKIRPAAWARSSPTSRCPI